MFGAWRKLSSASLDDWLTAATRGLCDDARERIGEEIESHYADALAKAEADGLDADEARVQAVRSLGDPRRARRRLRRQHLTRFQARVARKLEEKRRGRWFRFKSEPVSVKKRLKFLAFIAVVASLLPALTFLPVYFFAPELFPPLALLFASPAEVLGFLGPPGFLVAWYGIAAFIGLNRKYNHELTLSEYAARRAGYYLSGVAFCSIVLLGIVGLTVHSWSSFNAFANDPSGMNKTLEKMAAFQEEVRAASPKEREKLLRWHTEEQREWVLDGDFEPVPVDDPFVPYPNKSWLEVNNWFFILIELFLVYQITVQVLGAIWCATLAHKLRRIGDQLPPSAIA